MAEKHHDWQDGAVLEPHSARKHKVLREYLGEYLRVRCVMPQQSHFRLALVDGFAGAGRYAGGELGSPLIILETLLQTVREINLRRAADGMKTVDVDCLFIVNDFDPGAIALLQERMAPYLAAIQDENCGLNVRPVVFSDRFETIYPDIKDRLSAERFDANVLFNLDQYGQSHVSTSTLVDLMRSYRSAEILYTFSIQTFISFLPKADRAAIERAMAVFDVPSAALDDLDRIIGRNEWLGAAERIVFDAFKRCAPYVSPFSIKNPEGWRYWMMHFANSYRARQVYNDILHQNASAQAHFGRSGLQMLAFDPRDEGSLYLFGDQDRRAAGEQLFDDVPRSVAAYGDAIEMGEFYREIYNETPAHSSDIHQAMIDNPDIAVFTPDGGERRKPHTIRTGDMLTLRPQRSFHDFLKPRS